MADIYPTDPGKSDSTLERNRVFDYVRTMLGDGMIEVELDPKHLEIALDRAITKLRQRSSNSVEESYMFLELMQDVNEYRLPDEVISVQSIFRRAVGSRSGLGAGGTLFEPFNLAYTNSYLLSGSMMGGLATYELFAGYQKLVGKMFGAFIEFNFRQSNHMLTILQRPFAQGEQVLLRTHNYRPDFVLLQDLYAKQWIYDYTLATSKLMLGEARSKFGTIAGPQSAITLNGAALMADGKAEIEKLEKEIGDLVPGGTPLTFVIG
jgi:hypothetical protein